MRRSIIFIALALVPIRLLAQRHSGASSPPTAPARAAAQPIVAVSSGMGAIQFVAASYGVPAPQSLARQLRADEERTRAAALSAIGAPGQYLQRGHVAMPRSIQLEFAALGNTDELDALLTVELDQHIVTAVLAPDKDDWRRIATVWVADPFNDPRTTPSTFVHTVRSLLANDRYSAVFRAGSTGGRSDSTENEAHLRILNDHAIVTLSFVSASRDCSAPAPASAKHSEVQGGCNLVRRWLQPDASDPSERVLLVTASGHLTAQETAGPLGDSSLYDAAHLRSFSCQPFQFSDIALRFEPVAANAPCPAK